MLTGEPSLTNEEPVVERLRANSEDRLELYPR